MKKKISFITELLNSNKINASQKERLLLLATDEIKKVADSEDLIFAEIAELKKRMGNIGAKGDTGSIPNKNKSINSSETYHPKVKEELDTKSLPKYINPFSEKGMSKFLKAYNESPILNSTCHEIDDEDSLLRLLKHCQISEYDFVTHLKCIKEEFENLTKYYSINTKIYSLIRSYIYGEVRWSTEAIEMSWSDNALLKWSLQYPSYIPNPGMNFIEKNENDGFNLPKPFVVSTTGKNITTFSDLILLFKSMFHINSNNSLKNSISSIIKNKKFNEWADIEINHARFNDNIHLYTDVDKLHQAFTKLVELIKSVITEHQFCERPHIRISFFEVQSDILFTIHFLNTIHYKSLMSTLSHPFGQSLPPIIENQINGLCNLELKANFGNNEFMKVNLWDGNEIRVLEQFENFEGVEFILKFER